MQDDRVKEFIKTAMTEASEGASKNHGGPFGAVVVKDQRIISRGHNMVLSSNDPTAHAEIVAIRRASAKLDRFDLSDCEIYSTCEPCPMCLSAIYWARIKKLFYGCTREDAAKIGFDDKLFYELIEGNKKGYLEITQANRDDCLKIFNEWDLKTDKTGY